MKRSSSDLCAKAKKQANQCCVCLEPTKGRQCRTCNKHICRDCLKKWKATCNSQRKKPDCPNCRTVWDKPNFYIKAPQKEPVKGRFINIYCGTSYVLFPICNGDIPEGYALFDPELMKQPMHQSQFVPSNLKQLERYAADLKWLFKDLENGPAVISTDIPEEQLKKKFSEAGAHLEEIAQLTDHKVYGSMNFEELIMAGLVMEVNLF